MAFFVELVDASMLVDGERDKDESLELPDARANRESLYRGVFWQVTSCNSIEHLDNETNKGGRFLKPAMYHHIADEISLADPVPSCPGPRPVR